MTVLKRLVPLVVAPAALVGLTTPAIAAARDDAPVVRTTDGKVRGLFRDGVAAYLGIPYAAPPTGEGRWRPPAPVNPWQGVRRAQRYGNTCPHITSLGVFSGPVSTNEDCLFVNVFAPVGGKAGVQRPVIVWIHGGGNMNGASDDYDGTELARGGDSGTEVVVVTFNYRVGLFGTFSHPAIDNEGHLWGNYGTLDQQAVLRWVQRNIAAFGGDPARVALAGQSAGSYNTGANLLSPLSKGLFNRAIFMSSPGFSYIFPPASEALAKGRGLADAIGCPGDDAATAACLRKLPVARLLQLSGTPSAPSDYLNIIPFVDGTIIPITPEEAWKTGRFNRMPIIGGSTRDEYTFFTAIPQYFSGWPPRPMDEAAFDAAAQAGAFCLWCKDFEMPEMAAGLYAPAKFGDDPMEAYQRLNTDIAKCREMHVVNHWARQVPVFVYDFTYPDAPFFFPKMPGLRPKASHTIDIQFYFRGFHGGPLGVNLDQATGLPRELNEAERELQRRLIGAWVNFAATGDPNGTGKPFWPRYTGSDGRYLVQDLTLATKPASRVHDEYSCKFWDRELNYQN